MMVLRNEKEEVELATTTMHLGNEEGIGADITAKMSRGTRKKKK